MFCEGLIIFFIQSDHVIGKTDCPNISVELVTFRLYFCEVLISNPLTVFSDFLGFLQYPNESEGMLAVPEIGPQSRSCASFPVGHSAKLLGYWLDGPVFESRQGRGFIVSKIFSPTLRPTQPLWNVSRGFSPGVKRPWC